MQNFLIPDHDSNFLQRQHILQERQVLQRLLQHDASLWSGEPKIQNSIRNCLGWTDISRKMKSDLPLISRLVSEIQKESWTDLVCLGMGGSSLAPFVYDSVVPKTPLLRFHILDSTSPAAIAQVENKINLQKTLFIVASKTGTTIESTSLHGYFYHQLKSQVGDQAGSHFIAITDEGTPLVRLAQEQKFRRVYCNPSDIGGRYSALSFFGLVAAGLVGIDLQKILDRVEALPLKEAEELGAAIAEQVQAGRDKLTLLTEPTWTPLALWIEQILAESSGKEGRGLIPISDEPQLALSCYGKDRVFVIIQQKERPVQDILNRRRELLAAGFPVIEIEVQDGWDLGAEYLRWEIATSVMGHLLRFNPFDQPDVQLSKEMTSHVLASEKAGELPPFSSLQDLAQCLRSCSAQDYAALMAFTPETEKLHSSFQRIRQALSENFQIATTFGYGPRFLHSTGQLHKGGPDSVIGLQFILPTQKEMPIPGQKYDFQTLFLAQAQGDYQALRKKGRRVFTFALGSNPEQDLERWLRELLALLR